ncbi:epidermal growth factor receptor kinase substrate 8-like protein 3b [Stegastes partitus]|uniref:Epidermal growth factor receptor kinase substrate 8-like protein 3b n=1 Tax=Stegastes partitus TaxID=144197 RepID=A0A9Y4NCG0_9TELE|nr:PREDICTED: epidermal growth factor receptor kinase substrate 8-like protein 3 [Stegastes partitus]
MYGNNSPFSYSPRGFSQEDFSLQKRGFQQDDFKPAPQHRDDMSRPSGRTIYMQRKEYSEKLNKHSDNFRYRVEHLFTCELDGKEVKSVVDCMVKLKKVDAKGRVWPQEMIMEAQGGYLILNDIETKSELEAMPFGSILQSKAVLNSGVYNSVLTLTVQERSKRNHQVYMFQCEETGADVIKSDLDKIIQKGGGADMEPPSRDQYDIRSHLGNIIGNHTAGGFRNPSPRPVQRERTPSPPIHPPPQFGNREPVHRPLPRVHSPPEEFFPHPDHNELQDAHDKAEADRKTDILNHVINDMEIFMDKLSAVFNAPQPQEDKKKKGLLKMNNSKKKAPVQTLPPIEEYVSCLQKIKFGFNLLGQLDGTLSGPTAADYVHIFFTCLGMIVPTYSTEVPPSVISPLLTDAALGLLNQVVSPVEDHLWRSLGDCWNISRSRWMGGDVPPYVPQFYDGWQPPAPIYMPPSVSSQSRPMSRANSQRFPPVRQEVERYTPEIPPPNRPVANGSWSPPPPSYPHEQPMSMRVIYTFMARNNQELSVLKDEVVQVIQKSKQWWTVRNVQGEEGHVPQNVLEPMDGTQPMDDLPRDNRSAVSLDMNSSPAEVKAWLESRGFSRITVKSLGVLTGKLLLEMTRDEIRAVCPEEGAKVFFQLQGIRTSIELASEPPRLYHGRY